MRNTPDKPAMIVSLHDVSPESWPDYRGLVEALADDPGLIFTHLVVPDFHGRGRLDRHADFCRDMDRRLDAGDELVLHGFTHRDEGPPPRTPGDFLRRRILTHEAEFGGLDAGSAARKLEAGIKLFRALDWPLCGFVPPGWQINAEARRTLSSLGFRYTADAHAFYRLPGWQGLPMPTLVWSARSPCRRALFSRINQARLYRYRNAPVIRLALHPVDLRHRRSLSFWLQTIRALRRERRALTKAQWVGEAG